MFNLIPFDYWYRCQSMYIEDSLKQTLIICLNLEKIFFDKMIKLYDNLLLIGKIQSLKLCHLGGHDVLVDTNLGLCIDGC